MSVFAKTAYDQLDFLMLQVFDVIH